MYEVFENLLKEHNTTAYAVAKAIGISRVTLYDWRKGRSKPKIDKLKKIANFLMFLLKYFYKAE